VAEENIDSTKAVETPNANVMGEGGRPWALRFRVKRETAQIVREGPKMQSK